MADVQDYVESLAQNIGPRPAGTEEEQQASFFIEEVMQQEATLKVQTEEFNCNPNFELPRIICCVVSLVLAILTIFLPLMVIPSLVICIITAALFALDCLNLSPLRRMAGRGVSQNVIGKYEPVATGEQAQTNRRRKVVIVARYDTGKVRRELASPLFGALNGIHWFEFGAMILVPLSMLIRLLADAAGPMLIFVNVITVIGAIGAFLPVLAFLLRQVAKYNNGANCNAAGVAVMLEVAKRVGLGLYDMEIEEPVVHGEEAARAAGLIPEGARVEYAVTSMGGEEAAAAGGTVMLDQSTTGMEPLDLSAEIVEHQGLSALLPAIDAPDVSPVQPVPAPGEAELAAVQAAPSQVISEAPVVEAAAAPATPAPAVIPPAPAAPSNDNVPDWYKRARENAHKDSVAARDEAPIQRSKFAEAMEAAAAARAAEAEREQDNKASDIERRLEQMRASIMGQAAPSQDSETASEPVAANVAPSPASSEKPAQTGVGGFLSSTTDAPDYATASADLSELEAADAEAASETKQAGEVAERLMSQIPAAEAPAEAESDKQNAKPERRKRALTLPSLTGGMEPVKQRAPLGEREEREAEESAPHGTAAADSKTSARNAGARKVASSASIKTAAEAAEKPRGRHASMPLDDAATTGSFEAVSVAGSFTVGGATGAFQPVGDELLANVDPDDIYIEDADDSDYDEGFTEVGAVTGVSMVDMPKSRASRMFGRFRKNKKDDETSFSEAMGIQEDFDARKVGRERGGWESFRNNSEQYNGWDDDDEWNGGAFSRESLTKAVSRIKPGAGSGEKRSRRDHNSEEAPRTRFANVETDDDEMRNSRRIENPFANVPLEGFGDDREAIREFQGGPINMEVWFVALGAQLADNAGIKALIAEHGADLRGAMIIELEGLGAGELSVIQKEGMFKPKANSSRMKRYVNKAAAALGMKAGRGNMYWTDSAAYVAASKGYQTLHLAGLEKGCPAHCDQADDVVDNISPDALVENADFVMELIRAI